MLPRRSKAATGTAVVRVAPLAHFTVSSLVFAAAVFQSFAFLALVSIESPSGAVRFAAGVFIVFSPLVAAIDSFAQIPDFAA